MTQTTQNRFKEQLEYANHKINRFWKELKRAKERKDVAAEQMWQNRYDRAVRRLDEITADLLDQLRKEVRNDKD